MLKKYAFHAIAVLALVIAVIGVYANKHSDLPVNTGAIGTNPIENYIPAIKYNEGYYSELPVQTTSTITSAGLSNSGDSTLSGTTTITKSYDGFVAWDDFTVATGTAKAVYTNTNGPMYCSGNSGMLYAKSNGFSPSLVFSLGTSSSPTGYSTNLLASTTIATTTTTLSGTLASRFILGSNESIVGAVSDIVNTNASSTYYSNWNVQFGIQCWLIGA